MKRMGIKRVNPKESRLPNHLKDGVYENVPDYYFKRFKGKDPESVFNLTPKMHGTGSMLQNAIKMAIVTGLSN